MAGQPNLITEKLIAQRKQAIRQLIALETSASGTLIVGVDSPQADAHAKASLINAEYASEIQPDSIGSAKFENIPLQNSEIKETLSARLRAQIDVLTAELAKLGIVFD